MTFKHRGRSDQLKASLKRSIDAAVLMQHGRWLGAMYLAGYAVECRLKAKLMEIMDVWSLDELEGAIEKRMGFRPNLRTHEISVLMTLLDHLVACNSRMSVEIRKAYGLCTMWNSQFRYSPVDSSEIECRKFFNAVEKLNRFISSSC